MNLLAQMIMPFGLTITQFFIVVIAVCGACAVLYVILKKLEITPPDWVIKIFWIIVLCFIGIGAIKLIMGMM